MLTRRDFSKLVLVSAAACSLHESGWTLTSSPAADEIKDNQKYDLLIKGGTVIDPSQGLHAIMDVAVKDARIAAVAKDIPEGQAIKAFSAKDTIVTPGLIDLEVHCFEGLARVSINADHYCLSRGVTTVVENGGVGSLGLPGAIKYVINPSMTRIFVGLNVFPPGYAFRSGPPQLDDPEAMDADLAAKIAQTNKGVVVSIKTYLEREHAGTKDIESLTRALHAAEMARLPLVVDINNSYSPLSKIVPKMRKGDVFTHFYSSHPHGILDANGRILPEVLDARERGVLFDTADGGGQVSFDVVEKCFEQGFLPDTISTDLYEDNVDRRVFDLPTEVSKFMTLGLSLDQAIERVTARPAKVFDYGIQIGTLRPGSEADISIFELRDEKVEFTGSSPSERRIGRQRLISKAVVCRGNFFVNAV
jgi:dihydroorotase